MTLLADPGHELRLPGGPLTAGASERAFERLPRAAQLARMRRLAMAALSDYDLPPFRLMLIAHLFNTTFRVDTETGEQFMLRINRGGAQSVKHVGSEMEWLAALRRDTTLAVPSPVTTRSGRLLTVASAPGVPRPHICALFRWLPGKRHKRGLTPARMERVGELMARLHEHSLNWTHPAGFERGRVDWPVEGARSRPDPLGAEVIAYARDLVSSALSAGEAGIVADALERVRDVEAALQSEGTDDAPTFGLIHADLHYGNLLFARGTVRAIDFDDCGFGPLLYDFAVMLSAVLDWPSYPSLRAALLAGYRRVRPLSPEHEALLDTFVALRQVQDALWVLEWRVHPALGPDWEKVARECLEPVPALLSASATK